MNIGLKFRDLFSGRLGQAVLNELDNIVSGLVAHWQVNHNDDGTHRDVVATGDVTALGDVRATRVYADAFYGPGIGVEDIPETSIADGSILARVGSTETVTGAWTFSTLPKLASLTGYLKGSSGSVTAQGTPLPVADLGSGTANSGMFLRGDGVWKAHERWYNVRDYGAKGDNSTDDTSAIQAAIDAAELAGYGTIFFPEGGYKITSGLTVNKGQIVLQGAGLGVTVLYPTLTSGDILFIGPTGGATAVQRIGLHDFTVYVAGDSSSGATIHMERVDHIVVTNVECDGYFGGLFLESCVYGHFSNLMLRASNSNWSAHKSASYLLQINRYSTSGAIPSELHFVNCDWRANDQNHYLDRGIWLRCVDGVFFTNVHVGFCKLAGIVIKPSATDCQLTSIALDNVYVDNNTDYGILVEEPNGGGYTDVFGAMYWNNVHIHRAGTGIAWNMVTTGSHAPSTLSNIVVFRQEYHGIYLYKAKYVTVNGARLWDLNRANSTGYGVSLDYTEHVHLANVVVEKRYGAYAPTEGLNITANTTAVRVHACGFDGCTTPLGDSSTDTAKRFSDCWTDQGVPTLNADGNYLLTVPSVYDVIKFGTTNHLDSIAASSSWKGRKLTIIFTGTITVYRAGTGGNLRLSDSPNDFSATADDTLDLVCDGTNWFEVGRSVNAT